MGKSLRQTMRVPGARHVAEGAPVRGPRCLEPSVLTLPLAPRRKVRESQFDGMPAKPFGGVYQRKFVATRLNLPLDLSIAHLMQVRRACGHS